MITGQEWRRWECAGHKVTPPPREQSSPCYHEVLYYLSAKVAPRMIDAPHFSVDKVWNRNKLIVLRGGIVCLRGIWRCKRCARWSNKWQPLPSSIFVPPRHVILVTHAAAWKPRSPRGSQDKRGSTGWVPVSVRHTCRVRRNLTN